MSLDMINNQYVWSSYQVQIIRLLTAQTPEKNKKKFDTLEAVNMFKER